MTNFSKRVVTIVLTALFISSNLYAMTRGDITQTLAAPHTSRTIMLNHPSQTNWQFEFTAITEQSLLEFTDSDGKTIAPNTFLPINDRFNYGFSFQATADFDIIYAVTAISVDSEAYTEGNPKCTFLLTGLKPAVPENYVANFAGAKCQIERDNHGNLNLILDK
ncbi:MAG: hypothetical protein A3F46_08215 [Legionellales bacterium RIFCSPHIGHO2_12_FULL_42_9]|nr:MAG: hypothetical protein A3F46_08215 [Legionellales bacterium RIFCSPHIGHO2_12_FULL_42_9]